MKKNLPDWGSSDSQPSTYPLSSRAIYIINGKIDFYISPQTFDQYWSTLVLVLATFCCNRETNSHQRVAPHWEPSTQDVLLTAAKIVKSWVKTEKCVWIKFLCVILLYWKLFKSKATGQNGKQELNLLYIASTMGCGGSLGVSRVGSEPRGPEFNFCYLFQESPPWLILFCCGKISLKYWYLVQIALHFIVIQRLCNTYIP